MATACSTEDMIFPRCTSEPVQSFAPHSVCAVFTLLGIHVSSIDNVVHDDDVLATDKKRQNSAEHAFRHDVAVGIPKNQNAFGPGQQCLVVG